jgi:hypothetical protein
MDKLAISYHTNENTFSSNLISEAINLKHDKRQLIKYIDNLAQQIYLECFNKKRQGVIYCIHNNMYRYYGQDVHKLGQSSNMDKRMMAYSTGYIESCEIKLKSKKITNCELAEDILFYILRFDRISPKREFFNCKLPELIPLFKKIENMFNGTETKLILSDKVETYKSEIIRILCCNDVITRDYIKEMRPQSTLTTIINEHNVTQILLKNSDEGKNKHNIINRAFNLPKLTKDFLLSIKNMTNVNNFDNSSTYFRNDIKLSDNYSKLSDNEKQIGLIQKMVGLFWSNGLLKDTTVLKIYGGSKGVLSDTMSEFINEYCANKKDMGEVGKLFNSVRRKKLPSTQYSLLSILNVVINEFFGGFLLFNISKGCTERKNKKVTGYYIISINKTLYIELVLSKDHNIFNNNDLSYITTHMHNIKCEYSDSHNCKTFSELLNKN